VLVHQHLIGLDALTLNGFAPRFLPSFEQDIFVAQIILFRHELAFNGVTQHFGQGNAFDHESLNKNGNTPHLFHSVNQHLVLQFLARGGIEVVRAVAANGLAHCRVHDGYDDLVAIVGADFLMQGGQPVANNLKTQ